MSVDNQSLRQAVRLALMTSAIGTIATPALAQDSELNEVVVTGSRIVRPDYQSASPIVTVSEQNFRETGSTTVETMLNTLPQFVPSVTNTSNNPSNNGQANMELRGLGIERTLVLLDGKRIVPSDDSGAVDLNIIPASLISNVEIISGGASAAYGSDAIAGVVNIKTKDFEGLQFDGNWGQTTESDGEEWQFGITGGTSFADGRGKAMLNVAYAERDAVLAADRDFAQVALGFVNADVGFIPQGSGTIEEGSVSIAASQAAKDQVFAQYGVAPGSVLTNTFAFNSDGTLFTTGDGETPSVFNYRGDRTDISDLVYTYNFSPTNYLQLPLERTTAFGRVSFELTPAAELYAQGIYADYEADTQLAPSPASQMFISPTNPYIPADLATLLASRSDPTAPISLGKRVSELGPRFENNSYEVYQLLAGVRGEVFGGDWNYDVYGSYGEVNLDNTQLGSVSRTRFEELTFAPDGGASVCGGLNPFGIGSISEECADYIRVDALNTTKVKQTVAEATISGPLFDLPAGEVFTAFGVFYKKDESAFVADPDLRAETTGAFGLPVRADVTGFNATDDVIGDTDSTEFYTEIALPILADMPGVQRLEARLGYRYADYSTVGGVNSYKGELTYQPVSAFLLRGSYQRAVRAPNIEELFQPQVTNFPSFNPPDPCNATSPQRTGPNGAQVRDLCLAQGLPADLIDSFNYANQQVEGLQGGNPDLGEETADTITLGLVFRPELSAGELMASIDYYDIEIEDAIDAVEANTFVDRCYDTAYNPDLALDNFYCSFFTRNTFNGEITDAAELQSNIGAIRTSGIDVQLDWGMDLGAGRFGLNWAASYIDSYKEQNLPGDPFTEYAGTIGSTIATAFPEYKWITTVRYGIAGADMSLRWRFIDSMQDVGEPDFKVDSANYFDLTGSYGFSGGSLDGLVLRIGVTNLTDEDPKIYPSYVQTNTDPSTYDVLGRRYFVAMSYSFGT